MHVSNFLAIVLSGVTAVVATSIPSADAAKPTACFPKDVQAGVLNIQNAINIVINDIVQNKTKVIATDYSSTGRSLSFLERAILPEGCPTVPLPVLPQTAAANIAALQQTQLTLSYLGRDARHGKCKQGKKDICTAVYSYGEVAQYTDSIRSQ